MKIELPTDDYWPAWDARLHPYVEHPREKPTESESTSLNTSLWRSLDDGEASVQLRSIERYPYPPLKMPTEDDMDVGVESAGYWLAQGYQEPQPIVVSNCGISYSEQMRHDNSST